MALFVAGLQAEVISYARHWPFEYHWIILRCLRNRFRRSVVAVAVVVVLFCAPSGVVVRDRPRAFEAVQTGGAPLWPLSISFLSAGSNWFSFCDVTTSNPLAPSAFSMNCAFRFCLSAFSLRQISTSRRRAPPPPPPPPPTLLSLFSFVQK